MSAEVFNSNNKIGDKFKYQSIIGVTAVIDVVTRSRAWDLNNGEIIVKVTGVVGGVSIDHLTKENK